MKEPKEPKLSAVSAETAALVNKLHEALKAEFGCDFAYTIMGRGHFVATSNYVQGHIKPTIKVSGNFAEHMMALGSPENKG
jgi:hypothetical protein